MWAGTREAGLFRSRDSGRTWESVAGLNDHPTRAAWEEGGGGLLLHTILIDPENPNWMYACVSMGGAYRSEDAGASWQPINRGVADSFWMYACVSMGGAYRSEDAGASWQPINRGVADSL